MALTKIFIRQKLLFTLEMECNPIDVKCYSGQTYAERPVSFLWQGNIHKVEKVEKEWREPGEKYFLVRNEDERVFQLCYHEQEDKWSAIELIRG